MHTSLPAYYGRFKLLHTGEVEEGVNLKGQTDITWNAEEMSLPQVEIVEFLLYSLIPETLLVHSVFNCPATNS